MNDNDYRHRTKRNREFLESVGVEWEGGFDDIVKKTRLSFAKIGWFMSYDEVAYHLTQGGVDQYKQTGSLLSPEDNQ